MKKTPYMSQGVQETSGKKQRDSGPPKKKKLEPLFAHKPKMDPEQHNKMTNSQRTDQGRTRETNVSLKQVPDKPSPRSTSVRPGRGGARKEPADHQASTLFHNPTDPSKKEEESIESKPLMTAERTEGKEKKAR